MSKKKIIVLLIIVILVTGITYAWVELTTDPEDNTNVSVTVNGLQVTFNGGPNIENAHLIPVSTREYGLSIGKVVEKDIEVSVETQVCMNLYLTAEIFPTEENAGLNEETFVWELYRENELVNDGNFSEVAQGDTITLLSDVINATTQNYKLYIWLDGSVDNPERVENQEFEFILSADAIDGVQNATNKIINLSKGNTWSTGASGLYEVSYTKQDGTTIGKDYRYIGGNVNNYIRFNNDLYRIIGVFDENTHGIEGEYLIKIISKDLLSANSWGVVNTGANTGTYSSYYNDWTGKQRATPANINILLNEYFLNKTDTSSTYGSCSNWTYFSSGNYYKTGDCQTLVYYGINEELRDYIETTTWHLNGYNGSGLTSNNFYLCERGMYTNCKSANNGAADSTTTAKIGLMYVSDYMYASGYKEKTSTLTGSSAYNGNQNWLYKGDEWTITPDYSDANYVFGVYSSGLVDSYNSSPGFGARPTFYLKSSVYVTGGDGSIDNPYTIGM